MKAQDPAAIVRSRRRRSAGSDRRDGAEGCLHRPRAAGYGPNRTAVSPRPGPGDHGEAAGREGDDRGGEPVPGGVAAARHPARCGGASAGDRSESAEDSGSYARPHPVSHDHPGSAQGIHPRAAGEGAIRSTTIFEPPTCRWTNGSMGRGGARTTAVDSTITSARLVP